jgi:hypothetical protein
VESGAAKPKKRIHHSKDGSLRNHRNKKPPPSRPRPAPAQADGFGPREIRSNHERYDDEDGEGDEGDEGDSEDVDEDELPGAAEYDLGARPVASAAGSAGGALAGVEEGGGGAGDAQGFSLDLDALAATLQALPLHQRVAVPAALFDAQVCSALLPGCYACSCTHLASCLVTG